MTTNVEIEEVLKRIDRFKTKINQKHGNGYDDECIHAGSNTFYKFKNIKNLNDTKDELTSAIIWLWSIKDYFVNYLKANGRDKSEVYDEVEKNEYVKIFADLANSLKHSGLDKHPWTNKNPKIKGPGFVAEMQSIKQIIFSPNAEISIEFDNYDKIEITCTIEDDKGNLIGDTFYYLQKNIEFWENMFKMCC